MSKRELRAAQEAAVQEYLLERAADEAQAVSTKKNRATSTSLARETLFIEQFKEAAGKIFKEKIVPSKYSLRPHKEKKSRILNVVLSDLHYHSLLDPREVPLQYGPVEEARRTSAIAVQVAEYKQDHRPETTLYVHLAGDIIQGQLHDMRDGAPLAEQAAAAMHILSQLVSFWSAHFPKVVVRCTPGNHGRNTARHRDRATNQKFDSIENIVYMGVKLACKNLPNVEVEIPYSPYFTYEAFNQYGFVTHGDTVINPGYPGKTIDVAGVRKQINEINGKLALHERYGLFVVGHVHVASITHLPNGPILITNGALIPVDAYGLSIGAFDNANGQTMWESVPGHLVGDYRFAKVDEGTDHDKSLDIIIKPFTGF